MSSSFRSNGAVQAPFFAPGALSLLPIGILIPPESSKFRYTLAPSATLTWGHVV